MSVNEDRWLKLHHWSNEAFKECHIAKFDQLVAISENGRCN